MGSSSSKPELPTPLKDDSSVKKGLDASSAPSEEPPSGCPMHKKDGSYSFDPFAAWKAGKVHGPGGSKPLDHTEYNVYAQKINPDNQMPTQANQAPSAGQQTNLSKERVKSSIPKGGTVEDGTTWTYPSPQMFYNALARKKKLDDTEERDMESVVKVHNKMNEQTWDQILRYEKTLGNDAPKLLKFQGRPTDLSPKAAMKHYALGHPLPFDRHDWFIERNDGTVVRYVLDYYAGSDHSLHVDVRPAVDTPSAIFSRAVQMPMAIWQRSTDFTPLPLFPGQVLKEQYDESKDIWKNLIQGPPKLPAVADLLKQDCRDAAAAVSACESDVACQKASIDLTLCLGKRLCKDEFTVLQKAKDEDGMEAALLKLQQCVDQQQ